MNYADGTYMKFGEILVRIDVPIGYWVALKKIATPDELADGSFIGIWTNPASGVTYYDESVWIENLEMATLIGKKHDQLAIWDNENQTEVWLNGFDPNS